MVIEANLDETVERIGRGYLRYTPQSHKVNVECAKYVMIKGILRISIGLSAQGIIDSERNLAHLLKGKMPELPVMKNVGYTTYVMMADFFKEKYRKKVNLPSSVKNPVARMKPLVTAGGGSSIRKGSRYY